MHDPRYDVPCPMPGCDEPLGIELAGWYGLTPGDMTDHADGVEPSDAHSSTWKVACQGGHALLLPDESMVGCGCTDESTSCKCRPQDWDTEEFRTFRATDIVRLSALIEAMKAVQS